MKKQLFLRNAAVLTATALVLRAAGMLFRIYIAGCVGDEGMGLYQLIFTLYNFGITIATTGVTVACTRMLSQWLAQKKGSPARLAAKVLRYSVLVGTAAGLLLFFGAAPACTLLLKDQRALLALRVLAPSLPFMAAGAALRGCFAACRNVNSSSASQIFEQVIRIGLVAVLLPRALAQGTAIACAAVVLGNTVSEILSALYMYLSWKKYIHQVNLPDTGGLNHTVAQYAKISAPITATRGVGSMLVALENILVPASLTTFLGSRTLALAQFGQLKAMAMPVLFFPFSFLATISTLLLPEITEAHTCKDEKAMEKLVNATLLVTAVVSVLMSGLFTTFSASLGQLLYHSYEIGFYIKVLGPLMPCMYLESMVDGILRGLGEELATFRYSICDSGLRILGVLVLVPWLGMKGFLFVMLYSNLFTCILNVMRLLRVTGLRCAWGKLVVKPLASFAAGWAAYRFVLLPLTGGLAGVSGLVIGALTVSAVYALFVWLTGCISYGDLELFGLKRRQKA